MSPLETSWPALPRQHSGLDRGDYRTGHDGSRSGLRKTVHTVVFSLPNLVTGFLVRLSANSLIGLEGVQQNENTNPELLHLVDEIPRHPRVQF